jgi:hypothetical protein
MTEETKAELLNLVDQMAALDKKRHEVGRKLGEIREKIGLIQARLLLEIAQERD